MIGHFDFFPVLSPKNLFIAFQMQLLSLLLMSFSHLGVHLFCIISPSLPWHREEIKKLAAFLSHNPVTATIATCRSQATLHTNDFEGRVSACVSIHDKCVPRKAMQIWLCVNVFVCSPAHMSFYTCKGQRRKTKNKKIEMIKIKLFL